MIGSTQDNDAGQSEATQNLTDGFHLVIDALKLNDLTGRPQYLLEKTAPMPELV